MLTLGDSSQSPFAFSLFLLFRKEVTLESKQPSFLSDSKEKKNSREMFFSSPKKGGANTERFDFASSVHLSSSSIRTDPNTDFPKRLFASWGPNESHGKTKPFGFGEEKRFYTLDVYQSCEELSNAYPICTQPYATQE